MKRIIPIFVTVCALALNTFAAPLSTAKCCCCEHAQATCCCGDNCTCCTH